MMAITGVLGLTIKLVAVDLDDTLVGRDGGVSEENRLALARARERGVEVLVATGRPWSKTRRVIAELGLGGPAICLAGALVLDSADGRVLRSASIELPLALRIARYAHELGSAVGCQWERGMVFSRDPNPVERQFDPDHQVDSSIVRRLPERPLALSVTGGRAVDAVLRRFGSTPGLQFTTFPSEELGSILFILGREASKGHALQWICRQREIRREEVMALGDSQNDITMLQWAGVSVAMGWAPDDVKAAAQRSASADDEHAVATAIREVLGA